MVKGPVHIENSTYLHPQDLLYWELAQERVKIASLELQAKFNQQQIEELKYRLLAENLSKEVTHLQKNLERAMGKLSLVHKEIGDAYKVNVSEITYDDETGEIMSPPGVDSHAST